jgi:hypothetical protein
MIISAGGRTATPIPRSRCRNGQAWYAWRRTITGWCFAIGSAKAPPDQWRNDGSEPPKDFPGRDRAFWGSDPLQWGKNWD